MPNSLCLSSKWRECIYCARLTDEGHQAMVSDFNRSGTRRWRRDKASVDDFSLGWQLQVFREGPNGPHWHYLTTEAIDLYRGET